MAQLLPVAPDHAVSLSIGVGVVLHLLLFIRGEWHLQGPRIVKIGVSALAISFFFNMFVQNYDVATATLVTIRTLGGFITGVLASMTVYRFCFHRLRHFDGPFLAKFSKLWHTWHCTSSQNHLFLHQLHGKYGDFVRTGPSELTVFHPDIRHVTDRPGNICTKSGWYDMLQPEISLVSVRDKKAHDSRRQLWNRGFDASSLAYYGQRVLTYVHQLMDIIDEAAERGEPTNLNRLLYWFGWDVMGDVIFGWPFNMLRDKKWHETILQLKRAMRLLGLITPTPWLAHLAFAFMPRAWVVKDWFETIDMCRQRIQARVKIGNIAPDVVSQIVKTAAANGFRAEDDHWLTGDAMNAVIAGSDTVTGTLIGIFHHLAKDLVRQSKLYDEIKSVDTGDTHALASLPYLNAIINETLRMHPGVPTGGLRDTGPNGIVVGDVYIPGNTTIVAPMYSIQRSHACFERPDEFLPERWTTKPELCKNVKGFTPFGIGRYACVGKNLGMAEMRLVTANVVKEYILEFAPGADRNRFETEMKDCFTPEPGQVDVVFTCRGEW